MTPTRVVLTLFDQTLRIMAQSQQLGAPPAPLVCLTLNLKTPVRSRSIDGFGLAILTAATMNLKTQTLTVLRPSSDDG